MDVLKLTPMSYVVVFGASLASFATGVLEPTIALYLLELGLTFDRIGQILSAAFLMVAITALPLALFASRIGITRVLFAGGVAATAAGAFLYLGEGADSVYFFFICLGFAQAAVAGPGAAILAENPGTKRIAAFALFSTSWMIPPALGALVSTIWFSTRPGEDAVTYASIFPVVFFVLGASGVIYLLLLVVTLQSGRGPQPETDGRVPVTNQARLLFSPVIVIPFLLLTLSTFMSGAGAGSTLPFLPPYLRSLNANAQEISLLVMINNIAMGVATQFTAPLVNRFGDMKVYVVTTLLSVAT
ncbi:MAG: MFS transporter, partial [Candidatus Kariarchaeaceae archaeon]